MSFLYKQIDQQKLPFILDEMHIKNIKKNFITNKNDIMICSNFRSGSTLLQFILNMLVNNTRITDINLEWLEHTGKEINNNIYKTHYSYDKIPVKELNTETKIIYIQRNPKDVLVSMYEYYKSSKWINYKGDFETFFKLFMKGDLLYDRWDKHVQSFKKSNHSNILFIHYEDLIKNKKETILEIVKYLKLNVKSKKIKNIIDVTEFSYMKNKVEKTNTWKKYVTVNTPLFFRKGIIDDNKNYLTEKQSKLIDLLLINL